MTYTFRPAKREQIPLLLGVAGGTGSGKTMSALRLARGIADGHPFAGIDTENGRMSHYADRFPELHIAQIVAPFRPERYTEAIAAGGKFLEAVPVANRVVIVDSASHVWAGDGGCLDWQEELMDGNPKRSPQAWATVKKAHKKMVTQLLWMNCHVILCFRAEPKIDIVRENGEMKFVPKKGPTTLDGWLPISEKMLPYELTASFLLMADQPGVPRPIKLEEDHKPFVPLDAPLAEDTGRQLAQWASGSASEPSGAAASPQTDVSASLAEITQVAARLMEHGDPAKVALAIEANSAANTPAKHLEWLKRQEEKALAKAGAA